MKIKTVTLRGYKSIAKLEAFGLRNLNVLIGAHGANDYFNVDRTLVQSTTRRDKQ